MFLLFCCCVLLIVLFYLFIFLLCLGLGLCTSKKQMTMTAEEVLANGNTNLIYTYPNMTKTMRSKTGKQFKLHVAEGQFADSEIVVLLGE